MPNLETEGSVSQWVDIISKWDFSWVFLHLRFHEIFKNIFNYDLVRKLKNHIMKLIIQRKKNTNSEMISTPYYDSTVLLGNPHNVFFISCDTH